jgi:uncharacterized lipoprotein YddW (UPF0748 family)
MRRAGSLLVRTVALLLPALAGLWLAGCRANGKAAGVGGLARPSAMPDPVRAVWVARFHYRYPDDVRAIVSNCARLGCNTVLWQVRGNGTVAYRSRIEPWSCEFGYRDPGFDPLAVAVDEAHRQGLRIEAWVNLMPGWSGKAPPPVRNQLCHTHPEWFLHDGAGRRQPLNDQYVILNPCLPEVRRYLVSVVEELITNYAVDGVHLDYVRYAWETTRNARDLYPRDARTVALFRNVTGKNPDDAPQAWDAWRANQLTRVVADIRQMMERRRPGVTLTAAVWSDPHVGYDGYLQNGLAWLRSGLLDAAYPMAYTEQPQTFSGYVQTYHRLAPGCRVIPGLGIYKHKTADQMRSQLQVCSASGGDFALFSYDSLLPTHGDRGKKQPDPQRDALRHLRRDVLTEFNRR